MVLSNFIDPMKNPRRNSFSKFRFDSSARNHVPAPPFQWFYATLNSELGKQKISLT